MLFFFRLNRPVLERHYRAIVNVLCEQANARLHADIDRDFETVLADVLQVCVCVYVFFVRFVCVFVCVFVCARVPCVFVYM